MNKIANFIVEKKNVIFIFLAIILIVSTIGIFNVNVNYDMSKYLPDDSEVKIGMEKMNQDFGELSNITVMIDDLSKEERAQVQEELSNIENVKSVVFIEGDEEYQKDNHTKYLVNINADTYSDEAIEVLNKIQDLYKDKTLYVSGAVVNNNLSRTTLLTEIPFIAIIAVAVIFAILFILCDSWIEPFLFMTGIGIAVIINMGTNALLPSISFMTNAIGALLQLGLSMDYSIMLMNRYNQEKETETDNKEAMKKALVNSFKTITSSSVTTIVGLLVLAFMSFKIGQDMGLVLAKGVLISLLCIFTILPGLIITFDKLIQKTKKKSIKFNMTGIMKAVTKCRFVIVPVVIVLVISSFFMKDNLDISFVKTFDNPDQVAIEDVFGVENQVILLYSKNENRDNIANYIDWLEKQDNVTEVQDYSNTIRKEYTYSELAKDMNMDESQAKMLFQLYKDKNNTEDFEKITMYDLITFVNDKIVNDPSYSNFMDDSQVEQIKNAKTELDEGKVSIENGENELNSQNQNLLNKQQELKKNKSELITKKKELENQQKALNEQRNELLEQKEELNSKESELNNNKQQLESQKQELTAKENELKQQQQELITKKQQLESAGMYEGETKTQIENSLAQIEGGINSVENGLSQVNGGLAQINNGLSQVTDGKKQLEDGINKIDDGLNQLNSGLQQVNNGLSQINSGEKQINDGLQKIESGRKELEENKKIYTEAYDDTKLAELMEQDVSEIDELLKLKRTIDINVDDMKLSLEDFINYIADDIMTNETYSKSITQDMKAQIEDGKKQLQDNKELMLGNEYNRIVITYSCDIEGKDTFEFMKNIKNGTEGKFDNEIYFIGDSAMAYEMDQGFNGELNFVTALSVIAIFIVVLFTFKSVLCSLVLVASIQGAVMITTAIVGLQGMTVNYIALILVQCILMGATIDYGILYLNNYREIRKQKDKKSATIDAMNNSIKTILTSSLILIGCCLSVGFVMSQKIISQTTMIIAMGTLCAVIMMVFVLPALVLLLDKFLIKNKK